MQQRFKISCYLINYVFVLTIFVYQDIHGTAEADSNAVAFKAVDNTVAVNICSILTARNFDVRQGLYRTTVGKGDLLWPCVSLWAKDLYQGR